MKHRFCFGVTTVLAGLALSTTQDASAIVGTCGANGCWFDYTHFQAREIAIANTNRPLNSSQPPPGNGILCALHVTQIGINCYSPIGDRLNPDIQQVLSLFDAGTVKFGDSPSHVITSFTIQSFNARGGPLNARGIWIYVLRADNQIFKRFVAVPVATGDTFQWVQVATPPSARQIQWSADRLWMVGTDNQLYALSNTGPWQLVGTTPTVAIFGGDDTSFLTLNGTTGTATQFSGVTSPGFSDQAAPPAVGTAPLFGLALAQADANLAFSFSGRSNAVSCDTYGCFALAASSGTLAPNMEPAIYWSGHSDAQVFPTFIPAHFNPWQLFNTGFNPIFGSGGAQPHTIYKASSFRGIGMDIFVAQGNGHYLEFIPS